MWNLKRAHREAQKTRAYNLSQVGLVFWSRGCMSISQIFSQFNFFLILLLTIFMPVWTQNSFRIIFFNYKSYEIGKKIPNPKATWTWRLLQQPKTGNNDMVSKNYLIVVQLLCGALAMMLDFKSRYYGFDSHLWQTFLFTLSFLSLLFTLSFCLDVN